MDTMVQFKRRRSNQEGFTLIELLVVISIIIILMAIIVGVYSSASKRSNEKKARAEMKAIETAINNFHTDNNYYPPDSGGGNNEKNGLFASLTQELNKDKKNYLEGAQLNGDGAGNLVAPINHPEGNPVNYWLYDSSSPTNNPQSFDLWVFLRTDEDVAEKKGGVSVKELKAKVFLGNWAGDYMYEKYK